MQGWFCVHRELFEKPIWTESTPQQKTILMTLLSMASHKENSWEWQGKRYTIQPGQFVTSLDSIVKKSGKGITIQNVRTALKRFENYGFLTNKSTNKNRLITLENWEFYQGSENKLTSKITSNQQATNNYQQCNNVTSKNNSSAKAAPHIPYKEIIEYLNSKTGKSFKHTSQASQKTIKARFNEGYKLEDFKRVIDIKSSQWLNSDMEKYLRVSTLFGNKMDSYLNEVPKHLKKPIKQQNIISVDYSEGEEE